MARTESAEAQVSSPWMTPAEVAGYSRRHVQTIYGALREYAASNGRRGLKGSQPDANCSWRVRREDVDSWLAGEKPASRRLGRAS